MQTPPEILVKPIQPAAPNAARTRVDAVTPKQSNFSSKLHVARTEAGPRTVTERRSDATTRDERSESGATATVEPAGDDTASNEKRILPGSEPRPWLSALPQNLTPEHAVQDRSTQTVPVAQVAGTATKALSGLSPADILVSDTETSSSAESGDPGEVRQDVARKGKDLPDTVHDAASLVGLAVNISTTNAVPVAATQARVAVAAPAAKAATGAQLSADNGIGAATNIVLTLKGAGHVAPGPAEYSPISAELAAADLLPLASAQTDQVPAAASKSVFAKHLNQEFWLSGGATPGLRFQRGNGDLVAGLSKSQYSELAATDTATTATKSTVAGASLATTDPGRLAATQPAANTLLAGSVASVDNAANSVGNSAGNSAGDRAPLVFTLRHEVGSQAWVQGLKQSVSSMTLSARHLAEIRLDPPDMGPIHVRIYHQGAETLIQFQAQHSGTRMALEHSLDQLRDGLGDQGFNAVQVDVGQQQGQSNFFQSGSAAVNQGSVSARRDEVERIAPQTFMFQPAKARGVDFYA